ncbi:MAG: DsbA family protein [Sporichthyaceae bacterium]
MAEVEALEFTDPFCSYAWGTEPKYRRLQWQYGHLISLRRVFVGIIPRGWPAPEPGESEADRLLRYERYFADVSALTGAPHPSPIEYWADGSDQVCRVARAAYRQGREAGDAVVRLLRESLFVHGTPADTLPRAKAVAAAVAGFDVERLAVDLDDPVEQAGYAREWELARRPSDYVQNLPDKRPGRGAAQPEGDGIRYGLPCLELVGPGGVATVAGWRDWPQWEAALEQAAPGIVAKARPLPTPDEACGTWPSLTPAELTELCGPATAGTVR